MMKIEIEDESSEVIDESNAETLEDAAAYSENIFIPSSLVPLGNTTDNSSRLIVSKIIIENFKSYHGINEIAIHSNCTALIGPNDSGKSSTVDAILFAFGHGVSKLQITNLSCLIHSSSRYKKLNSSSVTLIFQHFSEKGHSLDEKFKAAGNEIIVKRTVFKDNSSFYELNEKPSTLKEIAALFFGCGIDIASNRFLILHGENDQIDDEHDQALLEYLEDIIGTTSYKVRIENLTEKIDVMEEKLRGKMESVDTLHSQLMAMERDNDTAAKYLKVSHGKIAMKNVISQTDGLPDFKEVEIYRNREAHFCTNADEMEKLSEQVEKYQNMRSKLNSNRYEKFMKVFKEISEKLLEIYGKLSDGGQAKLDFVNTMEPFGGVVFKVKPLEKSWKVISELSVGEKALASLSLVFAAHSFRSSPLYVMDDIDAHLDASHISRVRKYIRSTNNAQFIIASREKDKYRLCDRVISLYNDHECTKTTILNNNSK